MLNGDWVNRNAILTLSGKRFKAVVYKLLECEWDPQELDVTVSVPHKQLLLRLDVLARLVEDLRVALHGNQVLLLGEARALDQRHPVTGGTPTIHEVAQAPVLEDLIYTNKTTYRKQYYMLNCVFILTMY